MKYILNDILPANESITIDQFFRDHQISSEKIAVAVNNVIISKKKWESFLINAADQLEIIKPTQGG